MTVVPAPASPVDEGLTEVVDARAGRIRASGHLTRQGADLLSGTADQLRGNGHSRVVLDLSDVRRADAAGLDLLRSLHASFAAAGSELLIRHAPTGARSGA